MMKTFVSYARRQNDDQTIDSICTKCYLPVARAETEARLSGLEDNHRCEGFDLAASIHPETKKQLRSERNGLPRQSNRP
jgi:hypothetical protein